MIDQRTKSDREDGDRTSVALLIGTLMALITPFDGAKADLHNLRPSDSAATNS